VPVLNIKITDKSFFQKIHLAFFYAPHSLVPALYLIMLFSYLSYFILFNNNIGFYTSCTSILIGLTIYLLWIHTNPLSGLFNSYVRYYLSLVEKPFKLSNDYWWAKTNQETYDYGIAGYYNPILIFLGAVGRIVTNLKDEVQRLTFSWLSVISLLFLAPIGRIPWGQQWRIFI